MKLPPKNMNRKERVRGKNILSVINALGKHSDATAGTKCSDPGNEGCILILKF